MFAQLFYPAVAGGGPARSLTNLAEELAVEHEVLVVAPNRDIDPNSTFDAPTLQWVEYRGAHVMYVDTSSTAEMWKAIRLLQGETFDLVLLNSVWNRMSSFLPAVLINLGVIKTRDAILTPRGELEEGALSAGRLKKAIAHPVVRLVYRRACTAFAATSESERQNVRSFFGDVDVLLTTNLPDKIEFAQSNLNGETVRILFLGRIHETKGLLELVNSLRHCRANMRLEIAGLIEDHTYWQRCLNSLDQTGSNIAWSYEGLVSREELPSTLANSDILVTLTAGENFGHTIAEALQAGCAVVATDRTPWTAALRGGGGWVVSQRDDADAVSAVLDAAVQSVVTNPQRVRETSRRAYDEWKRTAPANPVEQLTQGALSHAGDAGQRRRPWRGES